MSFGRTRRDITISLMTPFTVPGFPHDHCSHIQVEGHSRRGRAQLSSRGRRFLSPSYRMYQPFSLRIHGLHTSAQFRR